MPFNFADKVLVTIEVVAGGSLTTDGTEQTVVEVTDRTRVEGWIDLTNMQAGDQVTIRWYVKIAEGGSYGIVDTVTYAGVQARPMLYFLKRGIEYGWKVTIQRDAGVDRSYQYLFFKGG